jgi:hypothetical protein
MLAARGRHWFFVVTVFWVAFIGPMLLWAYLSARREINAVLRRLQNALLRNQARVIASSQKNWLRLKKRRTKVPVTPFN